MDNHERVEAMTVEDRLKLTALEYERFAKQVFELAGIPFTPPCLCHSYVLGMEAVRALKEKLAK
jgi:hypothetical protein